MYIIVVLCMCLCFVHMPACVACACPQRCTNARIARADIETGSQSPGGGGGGVDYTQGNSEIHSSIYPGDRLQVRLDEMQHRVQVLRHMQVPLQGGTSWKDGLLLQNVIAPRTPQSRPTVALPPTKNGDEAPAACCGYKVGVRSLVLRCVSMISIGVLFARLGVK